MIVQALIAHELIHQQPLNPPFIILRTVAHELDKVWVLDNAEKIYFIDPLLVPLKTRLQKTTGVNIRFSCPGRRCRGLSKARLRNALSIIEKAGQSKIRFFRET